MTSPTANVRLLIVGDHDTGKTNLAMRFINGGYIGDNGRTLSSVNDEDEDHEFKKVWNWTKNDTTQTETIISILDTYEPLGAPGPRRSQINTYQIFTFNKTDINIVLLCYSIDNQQSFQNIQNYLNSFKDHNENFNDIAFILIGNKLDLEENGQRKITKEQGKQFADKNNLLFAETSAKLDLNIDNAFLLPMKHKYDDTKEPEIEEQIMENTTNNNKCCIIL